MQFGGLGRSYRIRNTLVPQPWDPAWTHRSGRNVLNQRPTAWSDLTPATPPVSLRAPFGEGNSGWINPTTTHTVPLGTQSGGNTGNVAGSVGSVAILTANLKRNFLVLQNNSSASVAGDTAPTFFIGFSQLAQIGIGLALPPGVGIVLDVVCPRDAIYLSIGPYSNAGASVIIQGVAVEGALTSS